ncbi:allophycocyanin subunit alpha-B [Roseofilum casamattae]|uniref:Allophycocyanin subunit alpha-B n=1 Tax=Roseofilum casamattae BLCC-M143 TaxID=3022442 RepID=A0ABT7BTZ1_9CYAN|nr:allophycocyanin subunit alpha-B [Roseofilum casamattae]MDJ1182657.1 allophycocyanin subunit alpha-B [Roseofilum casamattae BLCC-M143]
MSVVTQIILNADEQLRYPSAGELQNVQAFLKTGEQRTRIVSTLTENEKKIVDKATQELWRRRPDFIAPGGNASGQRERRQCIRDYGWYLRLVTYGVIDGSTETIDQIGVLGAREMYGSLGVPLAGMVEAMRCLKEASLALLSLDDADETAPYFDYLIQSLS